MAVVAARFDVFLVNLDFTTSRQIQKTRPCVVVSPDAMNRWVAAVIAAPMTSAAHLYATRVSCHSLGKDGQIVLDQLRTVNKARLVKHLGILFEEEQTAVLTGLPALFAR